MYEDQELARPVASWTSRTDVSEPGRRQRCRTSGIAVRSRLRRSRRTVRRPQARGARLPSAWPALLALGVGGYYGHYWWTAGRYLVTHRRRLRRRQERDPVAQGVGLHLATSRSRTTRAVQGRRRDRAHRRRRLPPRGADRARPDRRAAGDHRPPRQAGRGAAGGRRSGQGAARLRQGRRDPRRPRTQAPAGPRHAPDQQPAVARAGAGQLRPGRRGGAVGAGRRSRRRRPTSMCSRPSRRRRGARCKQLRDGAGQGRARPLLHGHPRARSTA